MHERGYIHIFPCVCLSVCACNKNQMTSSTDGVELEQKTHGCQRVSNRYLNSFQACSRCVLPPSHLPSIEPTSSNSNRTLRWCPHLKHIHVKRNSTRDNLLPTGDSLGHRFKSTCASSASCQRRLQKSRAIFFCAGGRQSSPAHCRAARSLTFHHGTPCNGARENR